MEKYNRAGHRLFSRALQWGKKRMNFEVYKTWEGLCTQEGALWYPTSCVAETAGKTALQLSLCFLIPVLHHCASKDISTGCKDPPLRAAPEEQWWYSRNTLGQHCGQNSTFSNRGKLETSVKCALLLFAGDCSMKEGMTSIIQDQYNQNLFQEGVPSIIFICPIQHWSTVKHNLKQIFHHLLQKTTVVVLAWTPYWPEWDPFPDYFP